MVHNRKTKPNLALTLTTTLSLAGAAHAAIDYTAAGSLYAQNFDTLLSSGTSNTWTNNVTLPGFYAFHSGATNAGSGRTTNRPDNVAPTNWQPVTDYRSTGTSGSRLYAWGSSTDSPTDRALGSLAGSTASADPGDFFQALVLRNTTGQTLTHFTLTYTGEQWFDQFNATGVPVGGQKLVFSYLTTATFDANADIPTQFDLGAYTTDSRLDFVSPTAGNTATNQVIPLDGNLAANRSVLSADIDVAWLPDSYLILRFWDDDNDGNDQPHGIDDLSFSAIPEPSLLGLAGVTALFAGRRRRR